MTNLILRYLRSWDRGDPNDPNSTVYDAIYTDRLTGREVMRYDAADPANTQASYGAITDEEAMASRGLDINEEIDAEKSVLPVLPHEVAAHASSKWFKAQRDQEIARSRDLFDFLGPTVFMPFAFSEYRKGEKEILRPALECRGFDHVSFYMIEEDSFGPLIRGCRAFNTKEDKWQRFSYG